MSHTVRPAASIRASSGRHPRFAWLGSLRGLSRVRALELGIWLLGHGRTLRRARRGSSRVGIGSGATRGGSRSLACAPTSLQDLLTIIDRTPVVAVVAVKQIVLAERTDPFLDRVVERRHGGSRRLLATARRDVCGEKTNGERAEEILRT